jgi:quercetin dioxygenase-like cupin family protein
MPTQVDYRDGDEKAPGMFFLREALKCENLGLTVVDADDGWAGTEHDHADEAHEEVYLLARGSATLVVDGEDHELSEGDAVRVAPGETRRLQAGDGGAHVVIAGAP